MANIKSINVRFPIELHEKLKKSAEKNRRSINAEILIAIEDHVKRTLEEE